MNLTEKIQPCGGRSAPPPTAGHGGYPGSIKTRTHLYTFPIENDADKAAMEAALERLSADLELTHALRLKGGHRGLITLPDVDPDDAWSAIERVVPDWQRLFLPRSTLGA